MRSVMLIAVSVVLLSAVAQAQDPEQSWGNLRTLQAGQKIQVVDQNLKSQDGTFVRVSDEAITFQVRQDEVTIQRADVFRVSSRERSKRGRNALIGLAIGGAIGVVVGIPVAGRIRNATPGDMTWIAATLGGIVGGIGAGIGAALPAGQPTIYRAERRQTQTAP